MAGAAGQEPVSPDGWQAGAPRDEIRPRFSYEPTSGPHDIAALVIAADARQGLNGYWRKTFTVTEGAFYRFHALCKTENIAAPRRSAVVEIVWQDATGKTVPTDMGSVEAEMPAQHGAGPDGWTEVSDVYRPRRAIRATVDLRLRWASNAAVRWSDISFVPSAAPPKRLVRLAAAHLRPEGGRSVADNLHMIEALVAEAAVKKADLIVFGELVTTQNVRPAPDMEPVPGPTTARLGEIARRHNLYIVAGVREREGHLVYNTAVLIAPDGSLAGKYRKVVITSGEARHGTMPGEDYPVFETRFGKIGMMICYDLFFPEVSRQLAMRGAEIIALPIYGGDDTLARVRALDNRVFLITSTYMEPWTHWMRSGVWDREGNLIAAAKTWGTIAIAEVDLNERFDHKWLGDFRNHVPRERPIWDGK
jgi:predicted amidohydrolase